MKHLNSIQQLEEIIAESQNKKIAIFKHSTSCGISRMVHKNFKLDLQNMDLENTEVYFLDLLSYRNVSNAIAEKTGVKHESPQLIVLDKAKVIHHSSHSSINATALA